MLTLLRASALAVLTLHLALAAHVLRSRIVHERFR